MENEYGNPYGKSRDKYESISDKMIRKITRKKFV